MNDYLGRFEKGRRIVVFGNYEWKGRKQLAGVVEKWRIEGVNENSEPLGNVCAERGLFLTNTFFQHEIIHRYTWRRIGEKRSLIDYIAVDERLRKDVLDAKVVRGALEGSDHYAVVIKI